MVLGVAGSGVQLELPVLGNWDAPEFDLNEKLRRCDMCVSCVTVLESRVIVI
jgi:hypothetical protein